MTGEGPVIRAFLSPVMRAFGRPWPRRRRRGVSRIGATLTLLLKLFLREHDDDGGDENV
jgi:hypothetical protein